METISNILHAAKDAVMGHQDTPAEQKPAEEVKPAEPQESKGVLSKIGEVMKEILLPPTEDLESSPKAPEASKLEQKESLSSTPAPAAAESSSKKETESLSGSSWETKSSKTEVPLVGEARFEPATKPQPKVEEAPKPQAAVGLRGEAKFKPTQPQLSAKFVSRQERLAVLLQPAIRAKLARQQWSQKTSTSTSTSASASTSSSTQKKLDETQAAERIQRAARRWLFRHRAQQREKTGAKMSTDEASRIIQERTRRWLDSTGFAEHKKARKHKKKNKHNKGDNKPAESKLEHFGRLVREARGELPEAAPASVDITDKAHLSAPAKAHLVEMIQQTTEAIKNRDESQLPKLKESDLYKSVPEPVARAHPEPTHTKNESGPPGPYIQQPRA